MKKEVEKLRTEVTAGRETVNILLYNVTSTEKAVSVMDAVLVHGSTNT